jgi:hypothetical protein
MITGQAVLPYACPFQMDFAGGQDEKTGTKTEFWDRESAPLCNSGYFYLI